MSTHTIQTEIKVRFSFPGLAESDHETAHPTVEITYDYSRGSPSLVFRAAKYINRDGLDDDLVKLLDDDLVKLQELAEEWLMGVGYDYACDCAETDLLATRAAHMEYRREQ